MASLIAFRLWQGIAPARSSGDDDVIGDLYTIEERRPLQGVISSVWAISAVSGRSPAHHRRHRRLAWIFWSTPARISRRSGIITYLKEAVSGGRALHRLSRRRAVWSRSSPAGDPDGDPGGGAVLGGLALLF